MRLLRAGEEVIDVPEIPFLASVIPIRTVEDKAALRAFQTILNRKDAGSYLDDIVAEAAALLERLGAFSRWARIRRSRTERISTSSR